MRDRPTGRIARVPPAGFRRSVACLAVGGLVAATTPAAVAATSVSRSPGDTAVAHTVAVVLAEDGSAVDAVLHTRTGEGGRSEPVDPDQLPVAVLVRYRLDGRTVDADELRGASGEVTLGVEVRNLTATPTRLEVPGPTGRSEVDRDVPVPLTATARLHLGEGWSELSGDQVRFSADLDRGGTRADWDAPLFPPVGASTADLELRGRVDGASVPTIHLDLTPVTPASSPALATAERLLEDRAVVDAVAAFFVTALQRALDASAEGAAALAEGLGQLAAGVDQAADGVGQVDPAAMLGDLDGLQDADLAALLGEVDLGADLDLEALLGALDPATLLEEALADLDLEALLADLVDDVDLGGLLEGVDLEELLAAVDLEGALVEMVDLETLLEDVDLAGLLAGIVDRLLADLDLPGQLEELLPTERIDATLARIDELLAHLAEDRLDDPEQREAVERLRAELGVLRDALADQEVLLERLRQGLDDLVPTDVSELLDLDRWLAELDLADLLAEAGVDLGAAVDPTALEALLTSITAALLDHLPEPELPPIDPGDLAAALDLDPLAWTDLELPAFDPADLLEGTELPDLPALLDALGIDPTSLLDELGLAALGDLLAELREGLAAAGTGGDQLAEGLEQLDEDGLGQLLERIDADARAAREDLALVEALVRRVHDAGPQAGGAGVSRHVRYQLRLEGDGDRFPWLPASAVLALLGVAGVISGRARRS